MKKILLLSPLVFLLLVVLVGMSSPDYKWLMFNGHSAEKYAIALLSNEAVNTPDWAIDLVVVKDNAVVTFSEHGEGKYYIYTAEDIDTHNGLSVNHLFSNWYVSKSGI